MLDEKTIRSSKSEVEEFKDSLVWLDILDELNDLARRAKFEYDLVGEPHVNDQGHMIVPTTSETLIHLGEIKGRRKAVSYFLNIPDILLQILEDKKNDTERITTD
uniref:Uncharacterized protein n=1 Tax=viral metagenome TaxID=1070528 RepID=A0A6H1ZN81_9ZZZZ